MYAFPYSAEVATAILQKDQHRQELSEASAQRKAALQALIQKKRGQFKNAVDSAAADFFSAMQALAEAYHQSYQHQSQESEAAFRSATNLLNALVPVSSHTTSQTITPQEAWKVFYSHRIPTLTQKQKEHRRVHVAGLLFVVAIFGTVSGLCFAGGNGTANFIGVLELFIALYLCRLIFKNHKSASPTPVIRAMNKVAMTLHLFRPDVVPQDTLPQHPTLVKSSRNAHRTVGTFSRGLHRLSEQLLSAVVGRTDHQAANRVV